MDTVTKVGVADPVLLEERHPLQGLQDFTESVREVLYFRKEDHLIILRPNKIHRINDTAFDILQAMFGATTAVELDRALKQLAASYGVDPGRVVADCFSLVENLGWILKERYDLVQNSPGARVIPFEPESLAYPVISEIALTYGCQNRCDFCYASSPYRESEKKMMSGDDVKCVIDKIYHQAKVPTISFTGGEPTLRPDLPDLIRYADSIGMRTNLITNGLRASDPAFVEKLKNAGLKSAQVSLEAADAALHDEIVGNSGAYEKTVAAIENFKNAGIYVHTNTTVSRLNRDALVSYVEFAKQKLVLPHISMNMIIRTGIARDNENRSIDYTTIGEILKPVLRRARELELKIFWYSPTPYCLFNPMEHGLGAKSCSAISGLLSVNPAGEIVPCSSFEKGIGSLLNNSFDSIWNSDQAIYYRERRYRPPVCRSCDYGDVCAGACPLYWEEKGGFDEIEKGGGILLKMADWIWKLERWVRTRTGGVSGLVSRKGENRNV